MLMKRQRMEIMTDILMLCTNQSKKTHIMYQTNLSHDQLKSYLALLTSQGLLRSNSGEYATTDKGLRFLDAFARLNGVLQDDSASASKGITTESFKEVQIIRMAERKIMKGSPSNYQMLKRSESSSLS